MKFRDRTRAKLQKATTSLNFQRRIIADRVYLTAIREARRLLTEGITLNPECDALHLELLKLEANAADFFKSRILPKLNLLSGAADENKPGVNETEQTMDVDGSEPTADASQIGTIEKGFDWHERSRPEEA
ncbi:unnamed protein product, partial [Echinostoma caproni]|uniref:Uncharacterized protein n=1 Tax=Echinostoma caproni TaxID=27848 RepID=A0A183BEI8_9TREM